jgi:hypothetical protein
MSASDTSDAKVRDPALFLWVFLHKSLANSDTDGVHRILGQFDRFADAYHLEPSSHSRPYRRACDIDLVQLSDSRPRFEVLVEAHSEYPKSETGTYYECLAYAHHDVLMLQLTITKFSDWSGTFLAGWDDLATLLRSGFDGRVLDAEACVLGATAVYWAIAEEGRPTDVYERQIARFAADSDLRHTATDLGGPLWRTDSRIFPSGATVPQNIWALVTPRSTSKLVNQRFSRWNADGPPDFAVLALALQKLEYEIAQYWTERDTMARIRRPLTERFRALVDVQRHIGPELSELRSEEGERFQRLLAIAGAHLADYRQSVGVLKQLRRTFALNKGTYVINAVAVTSAAGRQRILASFDQENAAREFWQNVHEDGIVGPDVGRIEGMCRQIDADIDYAETLIERLGASLHSASDQLQIAGQRELGEMAHHLSVDSAAVVASIVAIITVEAILKGSGEGAHASVAMWLFALAIIAASFAATLGLSSGWRGGRLERGSVAAAAWLFGSALAARLVPELPHFNLEGFALYAGAFAVGIIPGALGWLAHWWLQSRLRRLRLIRLSRADLPFDSK